MNENTSVKGPVHQQDARRVTSAVAKSAANVAANGTHSNLVKGGKH